MTRYRSTAKLTRLETAREVVNLVVEFDDIADFLSEYDATVAHGQTLIQSDRPLNPGSPVHLRMSFPGLTSPLVVAALVVSSDPQAGQLSLALHRDPELDSIVMRIRNRDRRLVARVIHVLIADENVHLAQLVANGLTAAARRDLVGVAFTFTVVHDGAAAIEMIEQSGFDVAIIDMGLPKVDGRSVVRHARLTERHAAAPIITLSSDLETTRAVALRAGSSVHLDKPVRLRDIVESLRRLVRLEHE